MKLGFSCKLQRFLLPLPSQISCRACSFSSSPTELSRSPEESALFGKRDGIEVLDKDSILKEIDSVLNVPGPPSVEYIFVEPSARSDFLSVTLF